MTHYFSHDFLAFRLDRALGAVVSWAVIDCTYPLQKGTFERRSAGSFPELPLYIEPRSSFSAKSFEDLSLTCGLRTLLSSQIMK